MASTDHADLTAVATSLVDDTTRTLFRDLLAGAIQELIEAELTASIGAGLHERSESRTNQRNGHRQRLLSTPAGDVELAIPKTRSDRAPATGSESRRNAGRMRGRGARGGSRTRTPGGTRT